MSCASNLYGNETVYEYGVAYGCGDGAANTPYDGTGQQTPTYAHGYTATASGTFTISGNTFDYGINVPNAAEDVGTNYIQVWIDSPAPFDIDLVIVFMNTGSSTRAIGYTDYEGLMLPAKITTGNSSVLVYFDVYDDSIDEPDEEFTAYVSVSGGSGTTSLTATVYIYDDDLASDPGEDGWPVAVHYEYDYLNRMVERTVSEWEDTTEEHSFDYDGSQIVLRRNGSGAVTNRYLWGSQVDQLLAEEHFSGASLIPQWPLADHLGTIRDLTDHYGGGGSSNTWTTNHLRYDSFGNLISESQPWTGHLLFGYTGRLFDEVTGLQNNLNRWYDAKTGQWMSEDPIAFAAHDPNIRRYAANQVTNATDPDGQLILYVEGIRTDASDTNAPFLIAGIEAGMKDGLHSSVYLDFDKVNAFSALDRRNSGVNKRRAAELATKVASYQQSNKCKEPIVIIAYSNGTTITTLALEMGMKVDQVIFLGSALEESADLSKVYKASPALEIYNFFSSTDTVNSVFGNAGNSGFSQPNNPNVHNVVVVGAGHTPPNDKLFGLVTDDYTNGQNVMKTGLADEVPWVSYSMGLNISGYIMKNTGGCLSHDKSEKIVAGQFKGTSINFRSEPLKD
jgi:RHS repeat-associated protein